MTKRDKLDILNTDKRERERETNMEYNTLDERLESKEFNEKLESNDYSSLADIFNSTPSGNTLADTGRYPE